MTKYLFFSGKGGVGKTTMATASAVYYALEGKKTLIVTTDPASNLADVFEQEIGHKITPIIGVANLHAMEIDPHAATREYRERIIAPFRGIMPEDVMASLEEQFNSPCTTEIASFDRFVDFMESDDYEVIIFDTAPTGHTLRLLDLPFEYAKQVEMMIATDEGAAVQDKTRRRFKNIIETIKDKHRTVFNIVLYPESTPIMEAYRAMLDLMDARIETQMVVANMVLPPEVCTNEFFANRRQMQVKYFRQIIQLFDLPVLQFPMMQEEMEGLKALNKGLAVLNQN